MSCYEFEVVRSTVVLWPKTPRNDEDDYGGSHRSLKLVRTRAVLSPFEKKNGTLKFQARHSNQSQSRPKTESFVVTLLSANETSDVLLLR